MGNQRRNQNFAVRVQEAALEIATREIERNRAGHYPTINVVGNYGNNWRASPPSASQPGHRQHLRNIGLQLALPLYAGGGVNSQVRQAIANQEKGAPGPGERAPQRGARGAPGLPRFRQRHGAGARTAAGARFQPERARFEQARLRSRSAHQYRRAERAAAGFSTMRDLSKARYDTLMNGLKLKAAAGTLTEEDWRRRIACGHRLEREGLCPTLLRGELGKVPQAVVIRLARTAPVRADRRLCADEKRIRAQSPILYKNNPKLYLFSTITVVFMRMCFSSA